MRSQDDRRERLSVVVDMSLVVLERFLKMHSGSRRVGTIVSVWESRRSKRRNGRTRSRRQR